jgi:hypothetical protein
MQLVDVSGQGGTKQFATGYQVALGMRTLPNPNFALGFEGGALGVFIDPGGARESRMTSWYGAATGTFYWSRAKP